MLQGVTGYNGIMRVRKHAGALTDSMTTLAIVDNNDIALATHIGGIDRGDVYVELYSDFKDKRTGWDNTYLILVKGFPWGFCDEPLV